jgi:hypothetical protein
VCNDEVTTTKEDQMGDIKRLSPGHWTFGPYDVKQVPDADTYNGTEWIVTENGSWVTTRPTLTHVRHWYAKGGE